MLRIPIYVVLIAVGLIALVVLISSGPPSSQKPEAVKVKAEHNKRGTEEPQTKPDFAFALPPSSSLASIAASADGKYLALARNFWSEKKRANMTELSLFDLDSGKTLWSSVYVNPNCCGLPIVKISPDAQFLLGAGRQLHLYTQDGQELKPFGFQEDDEFALSADLSSDGKYIAATSSRRAYLFSQDKPLPWTAEFEGTPSVALSAKGEYLLVATSHAFQLYRTADLELIQQGELQYQGTMVVPAISEDGSVFTIAGNPTYGQPDLTVNIFKTESPEARQIPLGRVSAPKLVIDGKGELVLVEWGFGGEAALVPTGDGSPRLFPSEPDSTHITLDAAGDRLAIAWGGAIEVRRLSDNALLWQTQVRGTVLAVLLNGDKIIALGNEKGDSVLPNRVWAWKITS